MPAKLRIRSSLLCAIVLAAETLGASPVAAQDALRVAYEVDKSHGPQTQIVGQVRNDGVADAIDVSVIAEALDRNGRALASGIAYVDSRIARGDSRPFTVVIPPAPNAVRYRVTATATRGFGSQELSPRGGGQSP